MGKRKGRSTANKETLAMKKEVEDKEIENEINGDQTQKFFACYLLTSLSPRHKGHTYIGFTVNPRRRIRQHNGEIRCGARRTKRKRPWEMVLCIHGFPTNVSALQFEWAWQHPMESLAVRKVAASFKSFSGVANKIKLAYTMLTLPNWQNLDITVNYFSTKYMKHCAGCPSLPEQMKVGVCPMDELPCYVDSSESLTDNEDEYEGDNELNQAGNAYGLLGESLIDGAVNHMESSESNSTDTAGEQFELRNPYTDQQPMPVFGLHPDMQFCLDERSPVRIPSPVIIEEENPSFYGDDGIETIYHPNENNLAATVDDNRRLCSRSNPGQEIEVIDVFTPSPNYRGNRYRKRRKAAITGAEIIDLTQSPIFV